MDIAVYRDDVAALAAWDAPIADALAYADAIAGHPRFEPAVRALSSNMLAVAAADRALDGVFKDAGRYVAAMLAIHLDATGGVTLPALKAICERSGFMSPGRARALLAYMVYLSYVEPLPVTRRGVPARYRLTARFVDAWRLHLIRALEAVQVVEPAVARVIDGFARPEVIQTFVSLQGEILFEVSRDAQRTADFSVVFLQRHAGTQLVHILVQASPPGDFLAEPLTGFSLARAARRLGVSRTHLGRMMDAAESRGMLVVEGDGAVRFLDHGRGEIAFHYALQIGRLLTCAARTLKAHPDIAG